MLKTTESTTAVYPIEHAHGFVVLCFVVISLLIWYDAALAITPSHHQNTHVFAHGRKNMNDIFNNYVCSASHMRPELHFQNVWREPCDVI